jgi:hypothetical protein
MNEIELSQRVGQLHLRLNNQYLERLITEIRGSKSLEELAEPFKSWLLNPETIANQFLTESARKAKESK